MGAHRGWIVAMLLAALAFVGGPELFDTTPAPAQTHAQAADHRAADPLDGPSVLSADVVAPRGDRSRALSAAPGTRPGGGARDPGVDPRVTAADRLRPGDPSQIAAHAAAEQGAPRRQWVPALPVSSSQGHAPAPIRLSAGPARPQSVPPSGARGGRSHAGGACSPESLQIFRC